MNENEPKLLRFPTVGTLSNEPDLLVDVEVLAQQVQAKHRNGMATLAKAFKGIMVVVDPRLEGLSYYLAVSSKMYDELSG